MHMHTCIYISPQLVHARLCNGAAASLPWKLLRTYLESCANIVQAVVSAHPPAPSSSQPPSCWPVARHVRLRNPIKSTLAHDEVAAVVLHKHHLIIRVGAGLIQFVYGSHWRLAADLTLDKNLFSLPFSRGFSWYLPSILGKEATMPLNPAELFGSITRSISPQIFGDIPETQFSCSKIECFPWPNDWFALQPSTSGVERAYNIC